MNIDEMMNIVTALTGLGLDDFLRETEGTEEEQFEAKMDNVAKMADHMNLGQSK
jgi:hypothetical protein